MTRLPPPRSSKADGSPATATCRKTEPIDLAALSGAVEERGVAWRVVSGDELDAWVGDASVLTDDHAPTDQLLTPYSVAS